MNTKSIKIMDSMSYIMIMLIPLRGFTTVNGFNIILGVYFFISILRNFRKRIFISKFSSLYMLFLIYCSLSVIYSHNLSGTKWLLMRIIPTFIMGLCISIEVSKKRYDIKEQIKYINKLFIYYVIGTVIASIYMLIFELPLTHGWGRMGRILYREEGQMQYSYHLIISITYLIYWLLIKRKSINDKLKLRSLVIIMILCILVVSALLTSIRKVLIGPLVFIVIMQLLSSKSNFRKLIINMILSIIFIMATYWSIINIQPLYKIIGKRTEALVQSVIKPTTNNVEGSIEEREILRRNAWDLFKKYPILGYGLDAFKSYTGNNGTSAVYAHNNYLEILASLGSVGFILYYYNFIMLFIRLYKVYNKYKCGIALYGVAFLSMQLILDYGQVTYFVISFVTIYFIFGSLNSNYYKELERKK